MQRLITTFLVLLTALPLMASDRVPGDHWMQFADPAQAGFDAAKLEAAKTTWKGLPSSAFMVIADGAVVAAWGDVERRFMCHSVRKSFLAALYGIYWDRGEIELNKTLADLGIDDLGEGLMNNEKRARILDLLKARSGVFHPAAYAGRTDSRPRGSEGPGRYFAYNNWDFNTLAAILTQETGDGVFEAFDEHFGQPLSMQDWRISDGYYHYELDKSMHPAYPFRLSARDAARFGLLFAREGRWADQQILSRHWVRRATSLYSIDSDQFGYGFMWWIAREPDLARHGFASALGVGNQMIAALPDSDLVIVNRANTYDGEGTPMPELLGLIREILAARTGEASAEATLLPLQTSIPDPRLASSSNAQLGEMVGNWPFPPAPLGLPERTTVKISLVDGQLISHSPVSGTFKHVLQEDGWLLEEDTFDRYLPITDDQGDFAGIADSNAIVASALAAEADGDSSTAADRLSMLEGEDGVNIHVARVVLDLVGGRTDDAQTAALELAVGPNAREVEALINFSGYTFLQAERAAVATLVFELNTRLFPESFNTWDSLGESTAAQGHNEKAINHYQRSLELNPRNTNAKRVIEQLQELEN